MFRNEQKVTFLSLSYHWEMTKAAYGFVTYSWIVVYPANDDD